MLYKDKLINYKSATIIALFYPYVNITLLHSKLYYYKSRL
jgi:hypothetical protein